jgi:hypothetical protein
MVGTIAASAVSSSAIGAGGSDRSLGVWGMSLPLSLPLSVDSRRRFSFALRFARRFHLFSFSLSPPNMDHARLTDCHKGSVPVAVV